MAATAWALVASLVAASPLAGDGVSPMELTYEATKLFMTARSVVSIEPATAAQALAALEGEDGSLLKPDGDACVRLSVTTTLRKRRSTIDAWLDAKSAQVWQRDKLETGHKHYRRRDRFAVDTVHRHRCEPRTDAEIDRGPDGWTERLQESLDLVGSDGAPFTLPEGLFLLLQTARLEQPGDKVEMLAYSRRALDRLRIEVVGEETLPMAFVEQSGQQEIRHDGDRRVLRLRVTAAPVGADPGASGFRFLGLEGDVDLLVDRALRVPVRVSGKVPPLGRVQVKLLRVEHP